MSNPTFELEAISALNELTELVMSRRHPQPALDQLAKDVHDIGVRFLRSNRCSNRHCGSLAKIPDVPTEYFCSLSCETRTALDKADVEDRVAEAMAEHSNTGATDPKLIALFRRYKL